MIGDGGFVFALEKRGYVKAGPWTPEAAVEHPEAGGYQVCSTSFNAPPQTPPRSPLSLAQVDFHIHWDDAASTLPATVQSSDAEFSLLALPQ